MLKKTITYTPFFSDDPVTEDFYFNLTKTELTKMNIELGSLSEKAEEILENRDEVASLKFFEHLILSSYGEKSEDGKRFVKSSKISEEFSQTPAYDVLFQELAYSAEAARDFMAAITPADMSADVYNAIDDFMKKQDSSDATN